MSVTTTPKIVHDHVANYLLSEVDCRVLSDDDARIACLTPLDYPDGDGVVVWIEQRNAGPLEVSDYGEGYVALHSHPAQDYKALTDQATAICRGLGVEFESGRVVSECADPAQLGDCVWRTASASAQIALALAFYRPRRRHREHEFTSAVADQFRNWKVQVERQHKLTGRSGHKHTATIFLPHRETVIEPIPADGHWNQVTAVYAKFGDLAHANGYRRVAVIDDRQTAPGDEIGKLLLQVSDVVQWSRRDEWMEAVT